MNSEHISEEVKQARPLEYSINPLIVNRWSPRAFEGRKVPDDVLFSLFEAARFAPSGSNEQPWVYIFARTPEHLALFHSFINESNRSWCERAPVLALVASRTMARNGNPNRTHAFDAGASWAMLALEATRQGLIAHAMGGFDRGKAGETLGLPRDCEPIAVIAIGYRGDPAILTENQRQREKPSPRNPLDRFLFEGTFPDQSREER